MEQLVLFLNYYSVYFHFVLYPKLFDKLKYFSGDARKGNNLLDILFVFCHVFPLLCRETYSHTIFERAQIESDKDNRSTSVNVT